MSYTFKSILAGIAPGEGMQAAGDYAISMAAALGAHVTGCSYALHPDFKGRGISWLSDDIIEGHLKKVVKEAHDAVGLFQDMAKKSKVDVSSEVFRASLDAALKAFGEQARTYDVSVVTQTGRGLEH